LWLSSAWFNAAVSMGQRNTKLEAHARGAVPSAAKALLRSTSAEAVP
jgi:hypothetical protein